MKTIHAITPVATVLPSFSSAKPTGVSVLAVAPLKRVVVPAASAKSLIIAQGFSTDTSYRQSVEPASPLHSARAISSLHTAVEHPSLERPARIRKNSEPLFTSHIAKWTGVIGAILLSLTLFGCGEKPQASAAAQGPPPSNVGVSTAVQQDIPVYGDWVATLDGFVNTNIQPQVSGYLIKQNYREGSFVHKGDLLFEIDPRPFRAALDQAKGQLAEARGQLRQNQGQLAETRAQLSLSEINVRRNTPLAAARAISQSQLDNDIQTKAQAEAQVSRSEGAIETSKAAIQAAEAAVKQAELNLEFTQVRSLIDGIAGITTVQIGNLVSQTAVLTTVSAVNPIKAYFSISEQEYLDLAGRVQRGSDLLRLGGDVPLQLTLSNTKVYPHQGRMIFADRQIDPQTGTIRIVGQFPNPGNVLRPGQFGRIRAQTAFRKGAVLIPQKAVSELQGRHQVAVVGSDNKVSIRTVETGERVNGMWIINSGLSAGEHVVTEGTSKVVDGAPVHPGPDTTWGRQ